MSQTRTIRELKQMVGVLTIQFEGAYPTPRDSPAGRVATRKIETLEMAIYYVEQSFHPPSEELEKWLLGRESDIAMGDADLGELQGVFKAVIGREAKEGE